MKFASAAIFGLAVIVCFIAKTSQAQEKKDRLLILDNGKVKVGAGLDYGGAITYLSKSGALYNLVNSYDMGREIQQSYYTGKPIDRSSEGQGRGKKWTPWVWNPIQVGDCHGNASKVLASSDDGKTIYVKTHPLLWDMNNEKAQCTMEMWLTLSGNTVNMRNKLTCFRTDDKWPAKRHNQELPAVYTIGNLNNLYTYKGNEPLTGGELSKIINHGPPWEYWETSEHWAARVDDKGFGVGVYNPTCTRFAGGACGPHRGGEKDSSCGYISPMRVETLDKDTVYEYTCCIIVGTLDEIRKTVYNLAKVNR